MHVEIAPDAQARTKTAHSSMVEGAPGGVLPLSPDQRELWLAEQFDPPDAPSRVAFWTVTIPSTWQRPDVQRAVTAACRRFGNLRTECLRDGSGKRILPPQYDSPWLCDVPAVGSSSGCETQIAAEIRRRVLGGQEPAAGFWWQGGGDGGLLHLAAHPLVMSRTGAATVLQAVASFLAGESPVEIDARDGGSDEDAVSADPDNVPFWRDRLAGESRPLDLPVDKSRPARSSKQGAVVGRDLDLETTRVGVACANRLGVGFDDLCAAGWAALLHRLSGTDRFFLALTLDDVRSPGDACEAVRPALIQCSDGMTFAELARALAVERGLVARRAGVDMGALMRDLQETRDPSQPWLASAGFATHDELTHLPAGTERLEVFFRPSTLLEGDAALHVIHGRRGTGLELRYNTDIILPETAQRWVRHLATLLEAAWRDPGGALDGLRLLSDEEEDFIRRGFNAPAQPPLSGPALLHRAFESQAASRPEHAAVVMRGESLSYRELDTRANRLAHRIREVTRGPGGRVALLLDRSLEYAVATLAVLKAGAAFVPIDPEWPPERQAKVLADCGARVILTVRRLNLELPSDGQVVFDVAESATPDSRWSDTSPPQAMVASDLAYVIYTSGSTGEPKGVMIDHRAAAVHMTSIASVYRIGGDDRCLLFHSVAFDPAIEQLFAPWVSGATVHIRGDELWTGREFSEWVRREGITAVTLPPRYWLQLLRDWECEPALAPLGQLRRVLVGGEALPPAAVELWRTLGLTSIRLLNGYGPTECTVTATVYDVPPLPSAGEASGRIPIGRPQGPVEAYVLDQKNQVQPIGVPGELCLAGPTLARGYLGRESLTRERFVAHPWKRGESMYRTGDRARFLADGSIDFCGRADRQVKLGGYRVEPGEIEAVLGQCAGVQACAVAVGKDSGGEVHLTGFVVVATDSGFSEDQIRRDLVAGLPRYMVPDRILALSGLPRTINGKLDTDALHRLRAEADRSRARAQSEARPPGAAERPRDPVEERIATVWSAVLGRAEAEPEDDFFLCGGHSLRAVALFARLEREFGVSLALRDWLAEPTFDELVALIRRVAGSGLRHRDPRGDWTYLFPIRTQGRRPNLFLFAGGRGCDEDFVVLASLTRSLGPDQPVWGLRLGGPDRLTSTHRDAVHMAADVAREIRAFQREGPYFIAGECIGGLLAYEVARRISDSGGEVRFLGLINTGCPRLAEPLRWWISTGWIGRAKNNLLPLARRLRGRSWREAAADLRSTWKEIARSPHSGRESRPDGMPEDPRHYFYGRLLLRYQPAELPLAMTLFGCETYKRAANLRRWSRHVRGGVQLVPLPGNTTTCIREFAGEAARRLEMAIDAARE